MRLGNLSLDNECMEAFAGLLRSIGSAVKFSYVAVEGEEVSQASWQALAEALEAVEKKTMEELIISEDAAWRGARVELGRCLPRIKEITLGTMFGEWEDIKNLAQLDRIFAKKKLK